MFVLFLWFSLLLFVSFVCIAFVLFQFTILFNFCIVLNHFVFVFVLLFSFVFFGLWDAGRSGRPGGRACRRELDSSQVTEVVAGNGFEQ